MQWAKIFGAKKVVVFDINDARLDLAKKLGADEGINTLADDFMQVAMDMTEGRGCLLYTSLYLLNHQPQSD